MQFKRGTERLDHGCDNQFRVFHKETSWCGVFASCHGAQLHACPIKYPGQNVPLLDRGNPHSSGAQLQHDGGRLVTHKLPQGRTIRVLFHACEVQKPILSLGCLAQQGYWSDLCADTGTLFFLDKIQTKHSQTQLHKEESLFLVKGMLVAPLSTAGVSDEVAQELQMPIGPQMLDDVAEPMLARPATLERSWFQGKSGFGRVLVGMERWRVMMVERGRGFWGECFSGEGVVGGFFSFFLCSRLLFSSFFFLEREEEEEGEGGRGVWGF